MAKESKELTQDERALVESLGADEVTYHSGGARLLTGEPRVTVAYAAVTKRGVRLRVFAQSLPAALTKGLDVSPIESHHQLSVLVPPEKVGRARAIFEHVARAKARVERPAA